MIQFKRNTTFNQQFSLNEIYLFNKCLTQTTIIKYLHFENQKILTTSKSHEQLNMIDSYNCN